MDKFKLFKGTGSLVGFVEQCNKLFKAFNNIKVLMPVGYAGVEPVLEVRDEGLVLDMGDALVFTLGSIDWTVDDNIKTYSAIVENGRLKITALST